MAYRLTVRAELDLVEILVSGAAVFGTAQALRYQDGIEGAFDLIGEYPLAVRERQEFEPPVRVHNYGAHVIIYVVVGSDAEIVRIRHRAEDWAAQDPSA